MIFDLASDKLQGCLFFPTAGCIPNATECIIFDGQFFLFGPVPDGDSLPDLIDNCPDDFNPLQEDFDGDGAGIVCDASFAVVIQFNHTFMSGDMIELLAGDSIMYQGAINNGANLGVYSLVKKIRLKIRRILLFPKPV